MRIVSPIVALATLFLSLMSASAQTNVTCHIKPFNTVSGPTLPHEGTANSINRYGNLVGLDAQGRPYIRFSNGHIQLFKIPVPLTHPAVDIITIGKRSLNGVTVGSVQFVDPTTNVIAVKGWVNQNGITTLNNTSLAGINKFGTMVASIEEENPRTDQRSIKLLRPTGTQFIPFPLGFATDSFVSVAPTAISDTGVVIGTYTPPGPAGVVHSFVEAHGQFQDFTFPGTQFTQTLARDINAEGMIVGEVVNSPLGRSFIFKDGTMFRPIFVFPNGFTSTNVIINGVNGFGTIVGTFFIGNNKSGPFIGSCDF